MSTLEKPTGEPTTGGHHNRWLVLAIVCFGQLMVILDATIVNVALPAIQTDLNLSPEGLQWIVNGYTLAFGGFLLLGGRLGDIYGRRTIFIAGVAVFTIASLLNGLAQSEAQLVGARALQGLGGALLSPAALSIITTEFQGPDRAKAMSVWGAIAGLGAALGLLLGGVLVKFTSWEWIFFVNVPVGVLVIAAAVSQIRESRAEDAPALDVVGAITATGGLVALVFGITQTESEGWGSSIVLISLGIAALLLVTFFAVERRHRDPLVPLGIFRVRSVSAANSVGLLAFAAIFPFFFFLSLFLQQVLQYDALKTGFAFLPFSVAIILTATVASQAVPKWGVRRSAMIGTGAAFIGMLGFGLLLDADLNYFPGVFIPMVFLAIGMGMTFVPLTFLATSKVPSSEAGLASGLFNTTQQIGGAIGLAILATLASDRYASTLADKATSAGVAVPESQAALASAPPEVQALVAQSLVDGWSLAFLVGAGLIVLGFIAGLILIHDEDADLDAAPAHIG
ncbi:MAG: MFS transporter [Solirubrobacteraceae bacterium]|nr:MFS transporter [Solirubrobacteraceae bacterium]